VSTVFPIKLGRPQRPMVMQIIAPLTIADKHVDHHSIHEGAGHLPIHLQLRQAIGSWKSSHDVATYVYSTSNFNQTIGMSNTAAVTTMQDFFSPYLPLRSGHRHENSSYDDTKYVLLCLQFLHQIVAIKVSHRKQAGRNQLHPMRQQYDSYFVDGYSSATLCSTGQKVANFTTWSFKGRLVTEVPKSETLRSSTKIA
jgi:hypothetical protein